MKQKCRPEKMKPGLKMQTPNEKRLVSKSIKKTSDMWEHLFSPERNKWRAIK